MPISSFLLVAVLIAVFAVSNNIETVFIKTVSKLCLVLAISGCSFLGLAAWAYKAACRLIMTSKKFFEKNLGNLLGICKSPCIIYIDNKKPPPKPGDG